MNFAEMSDEELERIAKPDPLDFSAMSDEELEKLAGPAPAEPEHWGKSIARSGLDTVLPVAGAIGGGMLAAPGSFGVGTIPGAALGYAAGKQGSRLLKHYLLGDELPAETVGDVALQTGNDLLEGATAEMGGQVVGKGLEVAAPYLKKGAESVSKAMQPVGKGLQKIAREQAFKSAGPMLSDFRKASARGQVDDLGQYMLDNDMIKVGGSLDDIAAAAASKRVSAGERLDDIYSEASSKFDLSDIGFDPKRDKQELMSAARNALGDAEGSNAALQKLGNYLDEIAARHGDKPAEMAQEAYRKEVAEYLPKFKNYLRDRASYRGAFGEAGADASQPVLAGLGDDLQRTTMSPRKIEINGSPAQNMRAAPAEPLMEQPFLMDLPTGKIPKIRVTRFREQSSGLRWAGDAANRIGQRTMGALEADAQQSFLGQNTEEMISMFGKQGEISGTGLTPRSYATADAPAVVGLKGQTAMPFAPQTPVRPQRPADIRNPMSPRRTNEIKTAIDQSAINYGRNPLTREPNSEVAFGAARDQLSKKVDAAIESLGGDDLLEALKAANKDYGRAKQIERISTDRINRESANQALSLTDKIAGGAAAAATGGPLSVATAAVTSLSSKLVRKYGNQTVAATANRLSQRLLRSPTFAEVAKTQPEAYKAAVYTLTNRVLDRSGISEVPKAAENELDRDSSTPAWESNPYPEGGDNKPPSGPDIEEQVKSNPQRFGKFAPVLQNAASRGPQGIAATHFILQNNPEYRKLLNMESGR